MTLKVVADCADICNFGGSPEAYDHKLDVLKQHCERVGRGFDEIEHSWTGDFIIAASKEALKKKVQIIKPKHISLGDYVWANIVGTPEVCLRKVEEYLGLGVTYFTLNGFSKIREPELELIAKTVMSSLRGYIPTTCTLLCTKVTLLVDAHLGVGTVYMLDFAEVYCDNRV